MDIDLRLWRLTTLSADRSSWRVRASRPRSWCLRRLRLV